MLSQRMQSGRMKMYEMSLLKREAHWIGLATGWINDHNP